MPISPEDMDRLWRLTFHRESVDGLILDFFQSMPVLLVIANELGFFVAVSAEWERAFGWTEAELCAKPWIDFVHAANREATAVAASKMDSSDVIDFRNRYRTKTGDYRSLLWRARQWHGGYTFAWAMIAEELADGTRTG